jgi:hypothetical protein
MKTRITRLFAAGLLFFMPSFHFSIAAQQPTSSTPQTAQSIQSTVQPPSVVSDPQAISKTGLLPVYGIDVSLDPSWVDGNDFPSHSSNFPNSGTSATFHSLWTTLQPGGYSVLRVSLDIRDAAGAAKRAANLCLWAKANNVQLIFLLTGSDAGQPLGAEFPKQTSDFAKALVGLIRGNNGSYLPNYSQIMAYQLEDELNHPGRHGGMTESAAQKIALAAAQSLRSAERDALNGSGVSATPLMLSASFDFNLISSGAIAGGTLSDKSYNQAYQSLKQFLSGLASSSDIDLLAADWYPGSLGGGGIEKAPDLLRGLIADVPGKQLILNTGFSTAFRSGDEQKRLFTTAFANLSDFRASVGADCPFIGTIFRRALNGNNPNPAPPGATLPADMDKWDWTAKAAELTAMWTKQKKSTDMTWWLARVENNMGLVSLQNAASGSAATVRALPAQQGMTQIASAVSDVNSQAAVAPASNPYAGVATPPAAPYGAPPVDASANPYAQTTQPQVQQPLPQSPAANSPYGAMPSNAFNSSPQASAASPYGAYGAAPTNSYAQAGCAPSYQPQQFVDPSIQYGQQQAYAPQPASPCSSAGFAPGVPMGQGFQGVAQQSMMTLLNGALQRLSGVGAPGSAFGSSSYFNASNNIPGASSSPFSYYTNGSTVSQPGVAGIPTTSSPSGLPGVVSPGSVQVGPQDVSIQPNSPQVGTPATIAVTLHNQNSADVYGLVVQVGGSDGTTLAQQASLHIAPNSSTQTLLQWIPSTSATSYGLTVSVADGSGNQLAVAQVGPLTIAAPANTSANNTGNASGTAANSASPTNGNTGSTASGTNTTSTTSGTNNLCATSATATSTTTTNNSTASTCASSNSGGTSSTNSGNTTSGTGSTATTTNPLGGVKLTTIQVGVPGQSMASGQLTTVLVPLLNPYLVSLANITGTLVVDGQNVQTQTVSALLPQQSRSLLFSSVSFAQSGQHQIAVTVTSQRPSADPLTSTTSRQINVVDASSVASAASSSGAPSTGTASTTGTAATNSQSNTAGMTSAGAATNASTNGASANNTTNSAANNPATSASPSVRSVTPQTFQIGRAVIPASSAMARNLALPLSARPILPSSASSSNPSTSGATTTTASIRPIASSSVPPAAVPSNPTGVRSIILPARPGPSGLASPATTAPVASSAQSASNAAVSGAPGLANNAQSTPAAAVLLRPGPGGTTQAVGACMNGVAAGTIDLSVAGPNALSMSNRQPRLNDLVTFTLRITNAGTASVQGAVVVFQLFVDGRPISSSQVPFTIGGQNCTAVTTWAARLPPTGQRATISATVNARGDINPANNINSYSFLLAQH